MYHHSGCGYGRHIYMERRHHPHEGCGCERHAHPPAAQHGCGCVHHGYLPRRFPSREELIQEMEEYLKQLQAEVKGVEERLAEMKKVEE